MTPCTLIHLLQNFQILMVFLEKKVSIEGVVEERDLCDCHMKEGLHIPIWNQASYI